MNTQEIIGKSAQKIFDHEPSTATEAIDAFLSYAASVRASDVHYDPFEDGVRIRLRIDGQVEEVALMSRRLHEEIIARLKILSGARTDIHAVPQDGRWKSEISGDDYNIRISFMPTYHGENAVIRLLPARISSEVSFAKLGFTPDHVRAIDGALAQASGLILVSGPTGSGKTTTLHSCLSLKSREPISIITLEDPVEYEIPLVRQVHIRHSHGVTFASGLRSALRQDPDVIMVGEIRDAETARVAIHTALTGHLVLSTIHTNSALEAIPRLMDMGVDPYLLASTLRLVVAQRLVRAMCRECLLDGCDRCRHTGYNGRSVIAEACAVDAGLKELIVERSSSASMLAYAKSAGFVPMSEDGHEKVEWGITTEQEVARVLAD
ncbi:MAG: type 4 fimbrial assembly protein PilB, type pilus assembly protein PilB [Candidatus Parcubacteria bacterium]|jgi:type II secretory ATPase GspE/PulE/Tfp pilus assembly ATPase PilB-like protein